MKQAVLRWLGGAVVVGVGALFFITRVPQSVSTLKQRNEQIRQLQKENADLAKDVAEKQERIRKLRDSRSEQELEIRQRLKLLREGETSFILHDQEKKATAQ